MSSYLTVAAPVETEVEIKRSRFLTFLSPVPDEPAARDEIARVRALHPKARHHCTAFVLDPRQSLQRSNDDGEPSGTAGTPMLETLVAAQVSDVVAVVVRYFGGVLLGAGGLTRAYRGAVADALTAAAIVKRQQRLRFDVAVDYPEAAAIDADGRRRGWAVQATYGETVHLSIAVPPDSAAELHHRLSELTAGRATPTPAGFDWITVPATP